MAKAKRKHNSINGAIAALISVAFLLVAYLVFGLYYRLNDDVLIRDFVSGIYTGTPTGYTVYMLYPLGVLFAGLYKLLPYVPWYGIGMLFLQLLCVWLVIKRLLDMHEKRLEKIFTILATVLFCTAFLLKQFVFIHYTVTGGLLMTTACFLFLTTPEKRNDKEFIKACIVPILLAVLSFFVRPQIGLFLLPLLCMSGLLRYFTEPKTPAKHQRFRNRYLPVFLIAVLIMGLGYLVDVLAYRSEEWKEYKHFNAVRTELYDFNTIPSYEENKDFYDEAGITEMQVTLLKNYNYMLDKTIDAELIEKINAYNDERRESLSGRLKLTLWQYAHRLFDRTDSPYNYIVIGLYVLTFLFLLVAKKARTMLLLFLTAIVRSGLWCYILFRGRLTDRITEPLLLCEILLLLGLTLYLISQKNWNFRVPVLLVASLIFLFGTISELPKVKTEADRYEQNAEEWLDLQKALMRNTEGNYYLIDVYSSVRYSERIFDEPLIHRLSTIAKGEDGGRNNEIAGGWCAFSPLMYEKHMRYEFYNAEDALTEKDHVYFVSRSDYPVDWLWEFYRQRGIEIEPVSEPSAGDFIVYKAVKKQ